MRHLEESGIARPQVGYQLHTLSKRETLHAR